MEFLSLRRKTIDIIRDATSEKFLWSVDGLTPVIDLRTDLGLDSLEIVRLGIELEEVFDIDIPNSAYSDIHTVADVVQLVAKLKGAP